jgi:hypothetical protein
MAGFIFLGRASAYTSASRRELTCVSQVSGVYMFSIITWPKPEQLTCVAPAIKRAKS